MPRLPHRTSRDAASGARSYTEPSPSGHARTRPATRPYIYTPPATAGGSQPQQRPPSNPGAPAPPRARHEGGGGPRQRLEHLASGWRDHGCQGLEPCVVAALSCRVLCVVATAIVRAGGSIVHGRADGVLCVCTVRNNGPCQCWRRCTVDSLAWVCRLGCIACVRSVQLAVMPRAR